MAKIDVTKIEGYDTMSDADKIAALLKADIPEPDMSGYVSKATFDKTASELASMKKEKRDALSEAEQKDAEKDEKIARLETQVAELTTRETISNYTAQFRSLGYDEKLAADTAKALAEGNMAKVFANQTAFITAHDKAYKAELMGQQGNKPPAGSVPDGKMDYSALITEASARGDMESVAYYTRLSQSKTN